MLSFCSEPTLPPAPSQWLEGSAGAAQQISVPQGPPVCSSVCSLWLPWCRFSPGPTFCEVTELAKAITVKLARPTCDPTPHKPPFLQWQALGILGYPFAGSMMDGKLGEKGQAGNNLLDILSWPQRGARLLLRVTARALIRDRSGTGLRSTGSIVLTPHAFGKWLPDWWGRKAPEL